MYYTTESFIKWCDEMHIANEASLKFQNIIDNIVTNIQLLLEAINRIILNFKSKMNEFKYLMIPSEHYSKLDKFLQNVDTYNIDKMTDEYIEDVLKEWNNVKSQLHSDVNTINKIERVLSKEIYNDMLKESNRISELLRYSKGTRSRFSDADDMEEIEDIKKELAAIQNCVKLIKIKIDGYKFYLSYKTANV